MRPSQEFLVHLLCSACGWGCVGSDASGHLSNPEFSAQLTFLQWSKSPRCSPWGNTIYNSTDSTSSSFMASLLALSSWPQLSFLWSTFHQGALRPCLLHEYGCWGVLILHAGVTQMFSLLQLLPLHKLGIYARLCQVFTLESCLAGCLQTSIE
jgi:hypothetical protein